MSHFEYISVAVALIYALVAGRLLTGLTPSLDESRRYPWIFGLVPWFTPAPVQPTAGVLVTLSLAGIVFKSESAHAVIVILTLLMAISAFYLIPGAPPVL